MIATIVSAPIVFLGDSITEEWSVLRSDLFARHGFVNRGIGGQTTRQIRARALADLKGAGARGAHILCGINDIAQNEGPVDLSVTRANLAAILRIALDLGIPAWVGALTPAARIVWNPAVRPAPLVAALNDWLAGYVPAQGATFIDYHTLLATEAGALRDAYSLDGVHLNEAGYRAMEPALLAALGSR